MTPLSTKEIIAKAGGVRSVSLELKINRQSVYDWIRAGRIPAERCIDLERLSGGNVRCEQMRPDVDWAYLRNPANAA